MNQNVILEPGLTTSTPDDVDLMEPGAYIASAIALFLIGFFGFFCNLLVIILMFREKQLWTPLNVILFNLVCSDFSVSVLGNPLTLTAAIYHRWIFGRTMCVIYGFFMSLLGIASITTLTVLAFERYVMISRPFQQRNLNKTGAVILVGVIWFYALCLTVPPLVGWGDYVHEAANISCSVNWESQTYNATTYIVFLFAFGLVVPVSIITFSYLNIIRTMRQNTLRTGRVTKAESKVALMIAVMIIAFLVAWTPYAVLSLIIAFGNPHFVSPGLAVVPALVAKSSICYNPLIYVGLNTQYRSAWQRFLGVRVTEDISQAGGGDNTVATPTKNCSQAGSDINYSSRRSPKFLSFLAKVPSNSISRRSPSSKSLTITTTVPTSPDLMRRSAVLVNKSSSSLRTLNLQENKKERFKVFSKLPESWKRNKRAKRVTKPEATIHEHQMLPNVKIDIYEDASVDALELETLRTNERHTSCA